MVKKKVLWYLLQTFSSHNLSCLAYNICLTSFNNFKLCAASFPHMKQPTLYKYCFATVGKPFLQLGFKCILTFSSRVYSFCFCSYCLSIWKFEMHIQCNLSLNNCVIVWTFWVFQSVELPRDPTYRVFCMVTMF